jgi:hypothetical protein
MKPARISTAVAALCLSVSLAGCSSGVDVPVPDPAPVGAAAYACAAMRGKLPDEVVNQTVVASHPTSDLTSAWGNPPITLRCGVARPPELRPTSELIRIDGVDWFAQKLTHGYVFTTVGRDLNVEVTVPDSYAPEANALADLSPCIALTIPASTSPTPSG